MIPTIAIAALATVRRHMFTRDPSPGTYLLVDATRNDIFEALGGVGYGPNWTFSFNYRGERVNLAYRFYEDGKWVQYHVRGWEHDDGYVLNAHFELEPTENPSDHYHGKHVHTGRGIEELERVLHDQDITIIQRVESP